MLNDAKGFEQVIIRCGYTDLRGGIDRLASIVTEHFGMNPFIPNTLFLFCGRRSDRIKGLIWEEDGFLLLYKRIESSGRFQWPRTTDEALSITGEQFTWLMQGLSIEQKRMIPKVSPSRIL